MTHTRSTGARVALSLLLALGLAGCDGGLFGPESGNVRFVLSSGSDAATAGVVVDGPSAAIVSADGLDAARDPMASGDHDDDDHHEWRPNPYFASANQAMRLL